jgi:hypothetical protein
MISNLSKVLLIAFLLVVAVVALSSIAGSNHSFRSPEMGGGGIPAFASVELGYQWLVRLIGGTIFLAALLGGLTSHENPVPAFAMRIAAALLGLELIAAHWALAACATAIVIVLVVVDGLARRRPAAP